MKSLPRIISAIFILALPLAAQAQYQVKDDMFPPADPAKEALGKVLFFDKILSGNQNTSCATCHHAFAATGDGLSLPVGAGGVGFGVARSTAGQMGSQITERVPRNAPPIFNKGANFFSALFHDGRVAVDPLQASGFLSPAGDSLPMGLDNALAVQAMFPVQSGAEMAGQAGENAVANAAAAGNLVGADGVWAQLTDRLKAIPEYVALFTQAYSHVNSAADITFVDVANAIGAFEASAWRCTDSPFDRAIGSDGAVSSADFADSISPKALRGADLFYGKANCASCHGGPFQTDLQFYAIAMPQIGPGKGDGVDGHDDHGRERVSGDQADRYKFRTPSLRQVAFTGPWGHDGAYDSLQAMVRHHLNPVNSLNSYDTTQPRLASRDDLNAKDFIAHNDSARRAAIAGANQLSPVDLTDAEFGDLMEFLTVGLTDSSCIDIRSDVPASVPSGLSMAD